MSCLTSKPQSSEKSSVPAGFARVVHEFVMATCPHFPFQKEVLWVSVRYYLPWQTIVAPCGIVSTQLSFHSNLSCQYYRQIIEM